MTTRIISVLLGFVAANYLYQAFGDHSWLVATERSIFQSTVMLFLLLSLKLSPAR